MPMLPFSLAAGLSCPTYADLAAALAAEFRPIDEREIDDAIDGVAAGMTGARGADALDQLDAVTGAMAAFEAQLAPLDTRALMIDLSLQRLTGHATTLAVIAVEAGRRAGLDVGMIGAGSKHFVGHHGYGTHVGYDPSLAAVRHVEHDRASWRCSHQVAFSLLREHIDRALRSGDIAGALRAAELRLELPMERCTQGRLRLELAALRSRLN